ncbi:Crp/Fnr family transcriptional regulator [Salinisphaera sp. LB1]|uniref:Crp/Fnr family transcriptional regulator n=1 Tax=Salinisphaera sp. LB1 TaxID=2183911 RepID=UPI000D707839|nr:cyclic nucleotide-binding domain-containing protein [Salinisphaera sp. LB1]AWN17926.1 cAMP-binding protein [Salinisphaera sp. LB1]
MTDSSIESDLLTEAFFTGLPPTAITFLAGCASQRQIHKDDILFHHGQRADRFYLLQHGCISIEVVAIEGPSLELQSLGPGKILGWSWLIPPYSWHFQARVEEPGHVIEFDGEAILAHCEADAEFGYALLKRFSALMSRRLEYAREKMMNEWRPPGFA